MAVPVDRAVSLYQESSKIPSVVCGSISGSSHTQESKSYTVASCWSQRDLQRMENVRSLRQHQVITDAEGSLIQTSCVGFPTERSGELLRCVSPSGKSMAVIRKVTNKKGDEKQYIEMWNSQRKILTLDVAATDKHGKIYEDEQFGCLEWSASERKLLYVAEKKQPKSCSYFETKSSKENAAEEDDNGKGNEFVYREDWGEQLVSKHQPALCVFDVESANIDLVEGVPDNVSPGQALWAPNDEDIIFVGWENDPYKLGLRFCPMRSCNIYHLKIQDKTFDILSDQNQADSNPRFNHDMSKLIYLRNTEGGPHMQCSQLIMYDWNTKETKIVVERQDNPDKSEFPGLYLISLPRRCWSSDNKRIYTHSIWRSCREIIEINIETQTVKKMTSFGSKLGQEWSRFGAWTVLDVQDDLVLAACASPNLPQRLVIGRICGGEDGILWKYLDAEHLEFSDFQFEIKTYTPKMGDIFDFEAILLTPVNTEQSKPPLIAFPHGGPHSAFASDFMLYPSTFCRLGFAVLLINYRGSIGFGNDFILSLLGNVGYNDVQDCKQAIDQTILDGVVDGDNVVLQGGSHGGFLVCHLIGQYPDAFKACVARNPVTNMASKLGGTDIPDWSYTECGLGNFFPSRLPTPEAYGTMLQKSPLSHVDKVKTPTMIMIGSLDKRVPPQQGYEYAKALKARDVETRVLTYPDDNHSLAKTNYEADAFINMFKWFTDHL